MPSFLRFRRRLLLLLAACCAALLAAAPATSHAYVIAGNSWARGVVPYHDASPYKAQVAAAVRAWNTSGARVKFVPVARSRAKLLISVGAASRGFCRSANASLGSASRAWVLLPTRTAGCSGRNPHTVTLLAAHELGHVLGLGHEDRRCATMNTSTSGMRPSRCPAQAQWEWRCRILEPDDVAGAVRRYGGTRRPRPESTCDVYDASPPPTLGSVARNPETYAVDVPLVWQGSAVVPPFMLQDRTPLAGTYVKFGWGPADACPTDTASGLLLMQLSEATLSAGAPFTAQVQDPGPGSWCLAMFAADALARPGIAATRIVDL